jgi:hypothetical protein
MLRIPPHKDAGCGTWSANRRDRLVYPRYFFNGCYQKAREIEADEEKLGEGIRSDSILTLRSASSFSSCATRVHNSASGTILRES